MLFRSMKTTTARNASFGPYAVDVRSGELRKNGIKLRMGGQPFRILVMLLANPGEMVTREDLRAELWADDTFVDFDHGLNSAVQRLVADSLHARQCRATAGENLKQQPVADGFGYARWRRKGSCGCWMPTAEENPENACDDGYEKCADKEIGGEREGKTSIAHAAKIEDGDDDQNADAERNRVRQQGRNGRDQSTDSGRNPHGGREDIIGEQRSRGKQAWFGPLWQYG